MGIMVTEWRLSALPLRVPVAGRPVVALVGAEQERVGLSCRLDFRALMASDLQDRARDSGGFGTAGWASQSRWPCADSIRPAGPSISR